MTDNITLPRATVEQEPAAREGFEKWAKFAAPYMDISRFGAGYSDCNTDYAWAGWQAALAQTQQQAEPTPWRDMVAVTLVREGINKHRARELADHFAAQQRPWVGLVEDDKDWDEIDNKHGTTLDTFAEGAAWAEAKLKERNT